MKYVFEFTNSANPPTHPHAFSISFIESPNGWVEDNLNFKTGADWLSYVQRKLLVLGITDVFCMARTPDTDRKEVHNFTFYFTNAAQCRQFQASTTPNRKGNFVRRIVGSTESESLHQEMKIREFFDENEIKYAMTRRDRLRLIVTTSYKQDDLIFAMHLANKIFDSPSPLSRPQKKTAILLLSNEKV